MKVFCYLTHTELTQNDTPPSTIVVIDVLRATSSMITALDAGAAYIIPCAKIADAFSARIHHPNSLLSGERKGLIIEGFDLSNSPLEFTADKVAGKPIVACTTNGTSAICTAAEQGAQELLLGSTINAEALAAYLIDCNTPRLGLVCAGTGSRTSLDDVFAAGMLINELQKHLPLSLDDGSELALLTYQRFKRDPLIAFVQSAHGRKLLSLGYDQDLKYIASA
ncbi:MAG: 2-phosphosulfolactate phosphatase, partial [Clostridia bacterium]|nr:2-phosphosulfolactate phosphatase [Clostridia bacterium]